MVRAPFKLSAARTAGIFIGVSKTARARIHGATEISLLGFGGKDTAVAEALCQPQRERTREIGFTT